MKNEHTVLFLPSAGGTVGAVWSFGDACVEEAFLSFADPPVLQAVEKHFRRTHPANPLARSIDARFGARWHVMDVQKQVEFDQWGEHARLRQYILQDL